MLLVVVVLSLLLVVVVVVVGMTAACFRLSRAWTLRQSCNVAAECQRDVSDSRERGFNKDMSQWACQLRVSDSREPGL